MSGIVVVSGAPAAGKSTLAAALAERLALPLLSKDGLKEALHDTLGGEGPETSAAYGRAAYAVLRHVLEALAVAGAGAVVDANFARGTPTASWLAALARRTPLAYVHLAADRDTIARRYERRGSLRHPVHTDGGDPARVLAALDGGHYEPLDLGVPVIRVEAHDGAVDTLSGDVERRVRAALALARP